MAWPVFLSDTDENDSNTSSHNNEDALSRLPANGNVAYHPQGYQQVLRRQSNTGREPDRSLHTFRNERRHSWGYLQPNEQEDMVRSALDQSVPRRHSTIGRSHNCRSHECGHGCSHSFSDMQPHQDGSSNCNQQITSYRRRSLPCTSMNQRELHLSNRRFSLESSQCSLVSCCCCIGAGGNNHLTCEPIFINYHPRSVEENLDNWASELSRQTTFNENAHTAMNANNDTTQWARKLSGNGILQNLDFIGNRRQVMSIIGPELFVWFLVTQMVAQDLEVPESIKAYENFMEFNRIKQLFCCLVNSFSHSPEREQIFFFALRVDVPSNYKAFKTILNGLQQVTSGVDWLIELVFFCSDLAIKMFRENENAKFYQIIFWTQQYLRETDCQTQQKAVVKSSDSTIRVAVTVCMVGLIAIFTFMHHCVRH